MTWVLVLYERLEMQGPGVGGPLKLELVEVRVGLQLRLILIARLVRISIVLQERRDAEQKSREAMSFNGLSTVPGDSAPSPFSSFSIFILSALKCPVTLKRGHSGRDFGLRPPSAAPLRGSASSVYDLAPAQNPSMTSLRQRSRLEQHQIGLLTCQDHAPGGIRRNDPILIRSHTLCREIAQRGLAGLRRGLPSADLQLANVADVRGDGRGMCLFNRKWAG